MQLSDVKVGQLLYCDDGFTCIEPNAVRRVHELNGRLWVYCDHGCHFLDGQEDGNGELIGFYNEPMEE